MNHLRSGGASSNEQGRRRGGAVCGRHYALTADQVGRFVEAELGLVKALVQGSHTALLVEFSPDVVHIQHVPVVPVGRYVRRYEVESALDALLSSLCLGFCTGPLAAGGWLVGLRVLGRRGCLGSLVRCGGLRRRLEIADLLVLLVGLAGALDAVAVVELAVLLRAAAGRVDDRAVGGSRGDPSSLSFLGALVRSVAC